MWPDLRKRKGIIVTYLNCSENVGAGVAKSQSLANGAVQQSEIVRGLGSGLCIVAELEAGRPSSYWDRTIIVVWVSEADFASWLNLRLDNRPHAEAMGWQRGRAQRLCSG